MVWVPVLLVSFIFFGIDFWAGRKNGKFQSRRGVTGYEAARHILDASGLSQITVDSFRSPEKGARPGIRQLYLEKNVCEGKTLLHIAQASREAVFAVHVPHSFVTLDLKKRVAEISSYAILTGWLALAVGLAAGPLGALRTLGLAIFVFVFMVALFGLPAEFEASERAFAFLKNSRFFEVDELSRLRNLLGALRFSGLGQIFKAPFDFVTGFLKGRSRDV